MRFSVVMTFVLAAGWLAPLAAAQSDCPLFATPRYSEAHTAGADYVAIGDLDGDSKPDVVLSVYWTSIVCVMRGNGDGTFELVRAVQLPDSSKPRGVAIGDLNSDDRPDLVTANRNGSVSILLNEGSFWFQAVTSPSFSTHHCVCVGDLNGDGALDVVVNNTLGVAVLLGNGDGTLQPAIGYPTGGAPVFLVMGDLNRDNKLDVVTENPYNNTVSVLLGNGDGTLLPSVEFALAGRPSSMAIGDLNGDGQLDVVTSNDLPRSLAVLLGNGDGTFQPVSNIFFDGSFRSLAIGEMNGDSQPDVLGANPYLDRVSGCATVLLGNGDGTFQPRVDFRLWALSGSPPTSIALGDLNGDETLDVALSSEPNGEVAALLNNTAPTISARCHNVRVPPDANCQGTVTPEMANNGSTVGIDCVPESMSVEPPGPYALGDTPITLTVTGPDGLIDTCGAIVTVAFTGDLDSNSTVGLADLGILLVHFGTQTDATPADGDLDGDGDVELSDLTLLLSSFGATCP